MTNTVVRYKDSSNMFPPVFGWEAFDKLFDEVFRGQLYEQPQGYPTDVIEIKNDSGEVIGYEIDVTLAGIPKENVEVTIEKDSLSISVKKVEKDANPNRTYLRKGISQKAMQIKYGLHGIDKEKIKANMAEGMLKVELPLAEEAKPRQITIG